MNMIRAACRWIAAALAVHTALVAGNAIARPLSVGYTGGGRGIEMSADGVDAWQGRYSARVLIDGQEHELRSADGELMVGSVTADTEVTPHGAAAITSRTLRFPGHGIDLLFRLGRVGGAPEVLLRAGITNTGSKPVQLVAVTPLAAEFTPVGEPADWLITALGESVLSVPPVTALAGLTGPLGIRECGGFYRKDGIGFTFGPVGAPVAFVDARIERTPSGRVSFVCQSDMSRVRVDPGETRWGQQMVLLLEPPRQALPRWADWVGDTHGARRQSGALSGWNSWAFLGGQVSGKDVLAVVDATLKTPDRLRPQVIQIDGGYEDLSGGKESNERFPEGMAFYAEKIAVTGARPGILLEMNMDWVRYMDWADAAERSARFVGMGYSYIKLNSQNITRAPVGKERQTSFEVMREGFAMIRKAVGETTYLLNNDLKPNRAAIGMVDAHRSGAESKRHYLRPTMDDSLRGNFLQGAWGAVDHDAYYLGTDVENVSSIHGGWPLVRTWASMVGLSCGAAITSDPWYWDGFKPLLRNVETMTPPARERTEVLDLGTSAEFPRLVGHVERDWGRMAVALLWNPGATERTVTLDFHEAGLLPDRRYAVWSFWDDRFLGVAKGSWTTPSLAPAASQHLRFTDLDQSPDRPVLIGSNLHI